MSTKAKSKTDARWFQDRLADKEISQRKFAKMVGMDPAALHYAIHGERAWKHDELVAFATIVGVPFDEALVHAGLQLPSASLGKGTVPVAGTVDATGELKAGGVEAPRRAPVPPEAPEGTVAVRFKTAQSAAEAMDGWLAYYVDGIKRVPAEAVGRVCVAALANRGRVMVAIVRRGYARGSFNLTPWTPGGAVLENVQVERASPVLWVRMSA
jgi:hypothetical protein